MSAKSRRKGAEYERTIAREWRDSRLFPHAERGLGQSRSAAREGCDVEGTPYWVEAKNRARHESPWAYMAQAEADTDGRVPVVVMHAPRKSDLVVMRRADWEAREKALADLRARVELLSRGSWSFSQVLGVQ
jgi:hypothetical protein